MKIGRSPHTTHKDSCRYCSAGFARFFDPMPPSEAMEILKWLNTKLEMMPDGSFCLCGEFKEFDLVDFLFVVLKPETWGPILGRIEDEKYSGENQAGINKWQRIRSLLRELLEAQDFESFFEGGEIDWLVETRRVEDDLRDRRHQKRKTGKSKGATHKKSRPACRTSSHS